MLLPKLTHLMVIAVSTWCIASIGPTRVDQVNESSPEEDIEVSHIYNSESVVRPQDRRVNQLSTILVGETGGTSAPHSSASGNPIWPVPPELLLRPELPSQWTSLTPPYTAWELRNGVPDAIAVLEGEMEIGLADDNATVEQRARFKRMIIEESKFKLRLAETLRAVSAEE